MARLALAATVVFLASASASARADSRPAARLAIEIVAEDSSDGWRAAALEELLSAEAAGFGGIETLDRSEAELVVHGVLEADSIRFEVRAASGRVVGSGRLGVRNTDRGHLGRELYQAIGPLVREGGALDRERAGIAAGPAAAVSSIDRSTARLGLFALAALLALPYIVGLAAGVRARAIAVAHSLPWSALTIGAVVAAGASVPDAATLRGAGWAAGLAGGVAWGWFGAFALRAVFPPLPGIERVEHREVFRVLRIWTVACARRAAGCAAVWVPLAVGGWWLARSMGLPLELFAAVVGPSVGVALCLAWSAAVDMAALVVDARLVDGPASADNEWHGHVLGYVKGYIKRAGWPADPSLLDHVLFLPGRGDRIVTYGSPGGVARVVIGRSLLELALAPYHRPHDYAPQRDHELHWQEWNAGLVVPAEPRAELATADQRRSRVGTDAGDSEWIAIGQPPTLAGYVEPSALDERHSHRPTEDPLWLEWDPGDEFDGTDPSDKDFLFGAIVRELGVIGRREHALHSVLCAVAAAVGRSPEPSRRGRLADAYASLNYARHHLVQYLAWRLWRADELLTARALGPELEAASVATFARLESGSDSADHRAVRRRLAFLASLSGEPRHARRERLVRRFALAGAALAVLVGLGVAIERAVAYHPTYVDRLQQQKQRIELQRDVQH